MRNTVAFEHASGHFTVEELVAMQFINMRKNAETMANEKIRDAILTVPPYFNQAQRTALIDAARLAGLKPLELINDGLAVALDYAKGRSFEQPQIHIIFDMGAGSTTATVVKFSTLNVKDVGRFNKTVTNIDVLGTGFSSQASGNAMTQKLYSYLLAEFDKSKRASTSISTSSRATARLLKEATRIKQVLSANNEAMVSLESLHEDQDFRFKVTRTVFEDLTDGLGLLSTGTIEDALNMAKVKLEDVDSLILHGGAARVPFVQKALLEILPEEKIARNVNADEAAVMGAVFRGAGLSGSFRVKEIHPQDTSMFSYTYDLDRLPLELFSLPTPFGSSKNISLSAKEDTVKVFLNYAMPGQVQQPMTVLTIGGISNASSSLTAEFGCASPEGILTLLLDQSGLVRVSDAFALCEVSEKQGVADKLKGWFGGKESTTAPEAGSTPPVEPVVKTTYKRALLSTKSSSTVVSSLDHTETEYSLQKIRDFEKHDNDRIARETARNGLEAYIYKVRDFLESESFVEVSTSAEQTSLKALSAKINDWMYDDGDAATLAVLVAKKKELTDVTSPILFRRSEQNIRKSKVDALQKQIESSRAFIKNQTDAISTYQARKKEFANSLPTAQAESSVVENKKVDSEEGADLVDDSLVRPEDTLEEPPYTEYDLVALKDKLDEIEDWLSASVEKQEQLSKTDDPVLRTADLAAKGSEISDEFMSVLRKAAYKEQIKERAKLAEAQAKAKAKTKAKAKSKSSTKSSKAFAKPSSKSDTSPDVPDETQESSDTSSTEERVEEPQPLPEAEPELESESTKENEDDHPPKAEPASPQYERDEL